MKGFVEVGDHLAVFGEILKAWEGDRKKPLIWHDWKINEGGSV